MIFECAAEGNDEGEAIVTCLKDNDDCLDAFCGEQRLDKKFF